MRLFRPAFTLLLACHVPTVLTADQGPATPATLRIAGEIRFPKKGALYLVLLSRDASGKETTERSEVRKLSPEEAAKGIVRYEFTNVAPGRYALRCFQDVNGNGKIDIGMFGPKEPWANYRPARTRMRPPRFDEMAFELKQDLLTADLTLE